MGIKARLKRLERDHGGRPGEPISTPMEVLLARIIDEERAQAERSAADPHLPPMEDVAAELRQAELERKRRGNALFFPVFATPIAESGEKP